MSGAFEGDLVRPLGVVTLYFGYADAEVNRLLADLKGLGQSVDLPQTAPLGQRLALLDQIMDRTGIESAASVREIIQSGKTLIDRRNGLVHASVLAGGRVRPSDSAKPEFRVTVKDLETLADDIFTWKETLSVTIQKKILPVLRERAISGT